MDSKAILKEVFSKAKLGDFAKVVQLIKDIDVVNETALNILICASNACYNEPKDSSKINKDELYSLLNSVIYCIDKDNVNEDRLLTYFRSIYHVIKYICDKEWFEELMNCEFVIIPTFLNVNFFNNVKEGRHVYQSLTNILFNSIIQMARNKKINHKQYLLNLIKLVLKVDSQINGCKETLSWAQKCLDILENLEMEIDLQHKFYFIVLERLAVDKSKIEENTKKIQLLITIFSRIISKGIQAHEFKNSAIFLENVITRTSFTFSPEFINSHEIINSVTAIFPATASEILGKTKSCLLHLKNFKTRNKDLFYKILLLLEEPLYHLIFYYKLSESKDGSQLLNDTFLSILQFLREVVCHHLVDASKKCSCGCSMNKNFSFIIKLGGMICGILKNYLKTNENDKEMVFEAVQWQLYLYELLKKVKEHNCKKWSQLYQDLGTFTYQIGKVLFDQKNAFFAESFRCLIKNSLHFEGCEPKILMPNIIEGCYNVLCDLEANNNNLENCMALAALYCLLYLQKSKAFFQKWWIKSKAKVKENSNIQQLTLVSILEKPSSQKFCNFVQIKDYLNKEKKIELLTYELTCYKTFWKSKESLMAGLSHIVEVEKIVEQCTSPHKLPFTSPFTLQLKGIWKLRDELLQNIFNTWIADESKMATIILEIFGNGDLQLHDQMPVILSKARKKLKDHLKNDSDNKLSLALAVLYFYKYKKSAKETASENLEEMEKTMQVVELAKEKFEPIPKDPNDECDIVSAYSNLRLNKFTQILKPLNSCLDLIIGLKGQFGELSIAKNISKLLVSIGFEYRLHFYSIRSLQAFELSLKCALLIADSDGQLQSISFLIENADIQRNYIKELISAGDKLVVILGEENLNGKYSKTLAVYQISKAKAFLYEDTNRSYEAWKIADALVAVNEEKDEFGFLRAELHILDYKLTRSCSFKKGEHQKHPMTFKLHSAYDMVITLCYKCILSSHEFCIMFDTVYELTKVYYLMRLPRDLRAYMKNSVLLAQKAVLPMRCVLFLILLAHSDLLTCKFDHCNVKLNGVNDILCLGQSQPMNLNKTPVCKELNTTISENEVESCISQIQELTLDLPQHTKQYSPSSPALFVESFKTPQFLLHDDDCICFFCLSFEYHQLLLQKYHLDAMFNMYNGDESLGEEFMLGSLMLYKTLRQKRSTYEKKASGLISENLIISFNNYFKECYGNILYDYSFYLMRQSRKSEALNINTKLIQLLRPKKLQYVHLYNDALLQRLSYTLPAQKSYSVDNEIEEKMDKLDLNPKEYVQIQVTPSSKKNTVIITVNGNTKYSPPKRRLKKLGALFTSPGDTDNSLKKSPEDGCKTTSPGDEKYKISESNASFAIPKSKNKNRFMPVNVTPLLCDAQTPKISIFTDDVSTGSIRRSHRKQPANSVKKQLSMESYETDKSSRPASSKKVVTGKNSKTTIHTTVIEEKKGSLKENCEEAHQPIIAGTSKTRQKLLTQKIKDSACKNKGLPTSLSKNLVKTLLADKMPVSVNKNTENVCPNTDDCETSSLLLESPEHTIAGKKAAAVAEKVKLSAKKRIDSMNKTKGKKNPTEPLAKKNLLVDFSDGKESSSKSTKSTGAIRKSTRNRVL